MWDMKIFLKISSHCRRENFNLTTAVYSVRSYLIFIPGFGGSFIIVNMRFQELYLTLTKVLNIDFIQNCLLNWKWKGKCWKKGEIFTNNIYCLLKSFLLLKNFETEKSFIFPGWTTMLCKRLWTMGFWWLIVLTCLNVILTTKLLAIHPHENNGNTQVKKRLLAVY